MTELKKKVRREFNSKLWSRQVVVEIDPAGYIRLYEKRCRRRYSISIEALFYYLCRLEVPGKKTKRGSKGVRRGPGRAGARPEMGET
jgi:hypothetical protein